MTWTEVVGKRSLPRGVKSSDGIFYFAGLEIMCIFALANREIMVCRESCILLPYSVCMNLAVLQFEIRNKGMICASIGLYSFQHDTSLWSQSKAFICFNGRPSPHAENRANWMAPLSCYVLKQ